MEILTALATSLRDWLPAQRWFAGKGRHIDAVRSVSATRLLDKDPALLHGLIQVQAGGAVDHYQLLLGIRAELPEHIEPHLVDRVTDGWAYDAAHDPELLGRLLDLLSSGAQVEHLRFGPEPGVEVDTGLRPRLIGAEQTNTSIVFGHQYILKLYRRPHAGPNRDLELHRALNSVGCRHIATPLATLHGKLPAGPAVLGMMQRFLPDAAEGWAMATTSVRDLLAERDLHPDEVGGDFAAEATRLGSAVATVHADLAQALGSSPVTAARLRATVEGMHHRLSTVLGDVPELDRHEAALRAAFDEAAGTDGSLVEQQVHGDLHLGQVLRSTAGWTLIDFEGEPAVPSVQRATPRSPLRDVAGMLRSFDYAAHQFLVGGDTDVQRETRALEWLRRNRSAFCDGYAEVADDDPRAHGSLLRAMELDKAVYEVHYEHHNRPGWLAIPLASIGRVLHPGRGRR